MRRGSSGSSACHSSGSSKPATLRPADVGHRRAVRAVAAQDAVARQDRHAAARQAAHEGRRVVVARDRDDPRAEPRDPVAERADLRAAAGVAEVADEEDGLVAGVVLQRVEHDAVVVQVGGQQRGLRVVELAGGGVGEQGGEAADRALDLARVAVARLARIGGGIEQLHEFGAARVVRGTLEGALVEARLGLEDRRPARDRGDGEDGDRRAREHEPAPDAEGREGEAEDERDDRRAAEGEAQRAQHRAPDRVAQPGLGLAQRGPRAARGADHDVALDGPRLDVQAHRGRERVEAHAPVGERDVGLDCAVGRGRHAHGDPAELGLVLAGARDAQPEPTPARARATTTIGARTSAAARRRRWPRRVGGAAFTAVHGRTSAPAARAAAGASEPFLNPRLTESFTAPGRRLDGRSAS